MPHAASIARFAYRCVSPPGRVLNAVNLLVHLPIIAPLVLAIYWAATCLLAAVLAPFALIAGLHQALMDARSAEVAQEHRSRMAVVVTGCDSGFGRALAIDLAARGYTVFAGCLNACSTEIGLARPFKMDVTSEADVDNVVALVRMWIDACPTGERATSVVPPRRLLAVVNNAGVGAGGWVDWLTMQDYERDMAVNFFGVVRVCKAFLPLLRESAAAAKVATPQAWPRILIVSSMSGKLPVPLLSSYSASKHAAAAFAACLRMELENVWNIHVCCALPSFHRTPLTVGGVSSVHGKWSQLSPSIKELYGDACAESCLQIADDMMTDWAWDPERVSDALSRAATQVRAPPSELTIGGDARFGLNALRHMPAFVYEAVIFHWYAWNLVMPAGSRRYATSPQKA